MAEDPIAVPAPRVPSAPPPAPEQEAASASVLTQVLQDVAALKSRTPAGAPASRRLARGWAEAAAAARRGFPFGPDRFLWGLSSSGTTVTIGAGAIRRAGLIYTCEEDTVVITADGQWAGWQFDPTTNTLTIIGPGTDRPIDGDGYLRGPLYQFDWIDGTPARALHRTTWQCGIVVSNLFGE